MKRYNFILSATLLLTTLVACSANTDYNTQSTAKQLQTNGNTVEDTATTTASALPVFNMTDLSGNAVTMQSLKGKKVFVNLWASWCPPCRAEMPSIAKLYSTVNKQKVAFIMLSFDENPGAAKKFIQKNSPSLPVYFPAEQPPAIFNVDGIPATFIFNERGELIKQNLGAEDYDTDAYRQLLQ